MTDNEINNPELFLTFSGFRDGQADDTSDGWTLFCLRRADGYRAKWATPKGTVLEVLWVCIQHDTGNIAVDVCVNDDTDAMLNLTLGEFVNVAPPDLSTYLVEIAPDLRKADSGVEG